MKSRALFFTCIAYSFSPLHEITDIFRHLMKCLTSRIACYMYVCMYVSIYKYISLSSDILRQISRHSNPGFPVTTLYPKRRFPVPFQHSKSRFSAPFVFRYHSGTPITAFRYHSGTIILVFRQALEFEFENTSLYSKPRFSAPSLPL